MGEQCRPKIQPSPKRSNPNMQPSRKRSKPRVLKTPPSFKPNFKLITPMLMTPLSKLWVLKTPTNFKLSEPFITLEEQGRILEKLRPFITITFKEQCRPEIQPSPKRSKLRVLKTPPSFKPNFTLITPMLVTPLSKLWVLK